MKALVTGGAGFIGSNLVDGLLTQGHDVSVIDNFSTGASKNLASAKTHGINLFTADIADTDEMVRVVDEIHPDVIFHLAAQIDVRRAVEEPMFDAQVNVGGTVNLLEAARRAKVPRFIFASTGGAIYGETSVLPTPEDARIAPMAPYGVSKAAAESYCSLFSRLHGMSTVGLRLGNVYGPRQDPLGEAGVIAIFCGATQGDKTALVFGSGKQTRDYIFVGDVVNAFITAADSPAQGVFNIGTGKQTSVLDLVEALDLEPSFQPSRPGEVEKSCLAVSSAAQQLRWAAETSLQEGLDQTLSSVSEVFKSRGK